MGFPGNCLEYLLSPSRPSPTLSGLTSALGTIPASTTVGITSGSWGRLDVYSLELWAKSFHAHPLPLPRSCFCWWKFGTLTLWPGSLPDFVSGDWLLPPSLLSQEVTLCPACTFVTSSFNKLFWADANWSVLSLSLLGPWLLHLLSYFQIIFSHDVCISYNKPVLLLQ